MDVDVDQEAGVQTAAGHSCSSVARGCYEERVKEVGWTHPTMQVLHSTLWFTSDMCRYSASTHQPDEEKECVSQ